ncbi:hypothetical protein D3H64_04860 [Atopobacter sp. AH10]|nr:hypothetical protein D3H64_04860 [Atopobacter sp. AH10]
MKKTKILIGMMILSWIVLSYRFYEAFLKKVKLMDIPSTGDHLIDSMLNESNHFSYQQALFQQNSSNKLLLIFLFLLLAVSFFSYIKNKFVFAHIFYIGYIVLNFIKEIYKLYHTDRLIVDLSLSDAKDFASISLNFSLHFTFFIGIVYLGMTFYSLYKTHTYSLCGS